MTSRLRSLLGVLGLIVFVALFSAPAFNWSQRPAKAARPVILHVVKAPAPALSPGEDDWRQFRGNAEQTGVSASRLPDKLDVLWTFKIEDSFESAVAVVGGVVYAGSMDEYLYAIDLATGKQKWKYKGGPYKSAPAVRGGFVYAGDLDGVLHCLDVARGVKQWSFEAGAEIGGINFHGSDILFTSHDENLYCLTKDGKLRWKFKTDGQIYGAPAVADGKTFLVGCDSQMHVIDVEKGKEIRSVDLGGQTGASAGVVGSHLYVGTMRNEVKAIDWKKGEASWTFKAGRNGQAFYSSPAATDKYIVIGSRDRRIHAIDRKKGEQAWSFLTSAHVDSSPVVVGNRVVVGSLDKNLYVLDLADGKLREKVTLDGEISASPVVVGGKVLVGTQKGTLYCLGAKK